MQHTSERREFLRFVIPSMLAFALSGLYSITDGFFVGNALGDNALAAVNIAYPMTAFIQAAGTGIGMGGAILYSVNAADAHKRRAFCGGAGLLLLLCGALLTAVFLPCAPLLLRAFGASGDIYALGAEYMVWISCGALLQVLGTGLSPVIRNMGGAVCAMAAMIAGFASNIVLDWLFIWVLGFGMAGAAAATVCGQAVSFLVCLAYLLRRRLLREVLPANGCLKHLPRVLAVGLSPFGLTFSPNIALILVNRFAANFSDFAVACYAAVSYISCVVLLLLQGVSDGSQPLISRKFGTGDMAGAKRMRNYSFAAAGVTAAVSIACLFPLRAHLAALFGASPAVAAEVAKILPPFLLGYLFAAFSRNVISYFYAMEKSLRASLLIYGEPAALLLGLFVLPRWLDVWGVWLAVPLSQAVIALAAGVLLLWAKRKDAPPQQSSPAAE